mgnify:CR=1 FL=1
MDNIIYIYKSIGQYLGFIMGGNLFSRDGIYLGWIEEGYVWDSHGQFKGELKDINDNSYILKNMFAVPPIPKIPKQTPPLPSLPAPKANIPPIIPPTGYKDGF